MAKHRIKIVRKSDGKNGFLILNEKGYWSCIPNSSKLSRPEFTDKDLCDEGKAKEVIDYLNEIYNLHNDLEIILEGCEDCLESLRAAVEEYKSSGLILRQDSQGVLVIGKAGSGKTYLLDALIKGDSTCTENDGYVTRKSGAYRWNELKGLELSDTLESVLQMIDKVIKEEEISTIIYCINAKTNVEKMEEEILDSINEAYGLRPAVVITNSIDEKKAHEIKNSLNNDCRSFIVLAKPDEIRDVGIVPAFGIDKLEDYIYEGL